MFSINRDKINLILMMFMKAEEKSSSKLKTKSNEFYLGVLLGIVGGVIGNFFVSYWIKVPENPYAYALPAFFAALVFFILIWYLKRKAFS